MTSVFRMEDKAFAVIGKDSVKMMAESAGMSDLQDDVAALLGEDVSYRLREVVMKSTSFMKNAKRRRLCPEDFNQALRDLSVQPVYGQSSLTDSAPFRQTKEGELHFVEDSDVHFSNTVFSSYLPKYLGKPSVKAQWMALEGTSKFTSSSHSSSHQQNRHMKKEWMSEVMNYYNQVTTLLVTSRPALVKRALADLSTNKNVQPALAYFINFIANGVKSVGHDVSKLTMLMKTAGALVKNRTIYLELQPYLTLLVQAVESCVLDPVATCLTQQTTDHWTLRQLAATVLATIVRKWSRPVNKLQSSLTERLTEVLQDVNRPLCSHYGAVTLLMALGNDEIDRVLVPHLPNLLSHLQTMTSHTHTASRHQQTEAMKVLEAIQLAMEKLLNTMSSEVLHNPHSNTSTSATPPPPPSSSLSTTPSSTTPSSSTESLVNNTNTDISALYQLIYDCFGDAFSVRLPVMNLNNVFRKHPSSHVLSLGDLDSRRSGDELLADLMQQVRQDQEEKQRQIAQQRLAEKQMSALFQQETISDIDSQLQELMNAAASCAKHEHDGGDSMQSYQEPLAVSSTISDPSRGTLKLKIKRHTQGQGSPSQPRHSKGWSDADASREKERLKRKKKQGGRNPWDQELPDLELSDLEEALLGQTSQAFSPGVESSGSDTAHRKGKLMLKLKVPSRDSPSD